MRRDLGRDLAARRRMVRLTQRELADKIGYHRSVVGHAEQGRGDAGPLFWSRIDEVLGTATQFSDWDQQIRAALAPPAPARVPGDGDLTVPADLAVPPDLGGPDEAAALSAYRESGWPVCPDRLALVTGGAVDVCDVTARAGRLAARWWQESGGRPDAVRGLPALPSPGRHLAVIDAGERWCFLVRGGACPWSRDDAARPGATAVGWHVPGSVVPLPPAREARWAFLPTGVLAPAPPLAVLHLLARATDATRDPAVLRLSGPADTAVNIVPVFSEGN
jgi:DNA-binding XRE family transcriptional regulator